MTNYVIQEQENICLVYDNQLYEMGSDHIIKKINALEWIKVVLLIGVYKKNT
jgi:hypothetical protein